MEEKSNSIQNPLDEAVHRSVEVLKSGGIILYPTDTVWGIGCDGTNPKAVKRIYGLKRRPDSKSMICLVHRPSLLKKYVEHVPERALSIMKNAAIPTTVIFPAVKGVAENLLAADGSLGLRLVKDEFCEKVLSALKKPLVSTSANISGNPTPAQFGDIADAILKGVDYIVPLKRAEKGGIPSAIIKLEEDHSITVIR